MTKFLRDSYNGLYVVLLKPYMPRAATVLALVLGVVIGLAWAYAIAPTIYYDTAPNALEQRYQDEWVKLLADRNAQANADISQSLTALLQEIDDPLGTVDRLIASPGEEANRAKLEAIRPFAEAAQPNAAVAPQPNRLEDLLPFILAPILVVVVFVIIALLWGMFIYPNLIEPTLRRARGENAVSAEVVREREQREAARKVLETKKTDFTATSNYGKPLMQKMSTFTLGHGQYDDSFTIEDADERFLGECGAGIAETIGVGDNTKPTAIEVWLFDKDDFVRTVTKVFVSEHAFNDPALRSKLEPKGDLVLAQPGATVLLETASLRLQARIVEMEYGTGPQPTNSYFQRMTIELAAWRKDRATTVTQQTQPVQASAPPLAAPAPTYTPPPPQNIVPPQSHVPGGYTAAPPPGSYNTPQTVRPANVPPPPDNPPEDDPFGGTGDFTPIT